VDIELNTNDISNEIFTRPLNQWNGDELVKHIISNYAETIFESAKDVRMRYKKYLDSIKLDGAAAMLDLRSSGTNLFNLMQLTGWNRIHGYAVLRRNVKSEHFQSEDLITPYIEDNGTSFLGRYNITTACDMAECIFTSPDGMLLDFDENGNPIFEDITEKHRNLHLFEQAWDGLVNFVEDFFTIRNSDADICITPEFADSLFGGIQKQHVKFSPELSTLFSYYEYLRNEFRAVI